MFERVTGMLLKRVTGMFASMCYSACLPICITQLACLLLGVVYVDHVCLLLCIFGMLEMCCSTGWHMYACKLYKMLCGSNSDRSIFQLRNRTTGMFTGKESKNF